MLFLSDIFGILGKKPGVGGGLTPKGKIPKPALFVFQICWVEPSIWQSFIQKGEMACISSAWSSGKLGFKVRFREFLTWTTDVTTVKTTEAAAVCKERNTIPLQ